ncbi:MAG TPA: 2Fe-2S iron-sulfur cluster-binding protein [Nocardioidaceae bacterium]|nr:2Fe-2S iron-sulfur cluster-binding protein [Nocardioidaceae bacterium]
MDEKLWWYLARAGGLTAWWLLCLAVLWGLLLSTRLLGDRTPPAWLLDLHRMLGGLALVFTGLHMTGLFFDEWAGFGWSDLLVPMASEYRPGAVAWGVVGLYLLVAIELTSLAKRRIPETLWRWVHRSAFAVFVLATVHTLTAGTDAASRWIQGGAVAVGLGFLFLLVYRLSTGRRPREPRGPGVAPVTEASGRPAEPEPVLAGVAAGASAPVGGTETVPQQAVASPTASSPPVQPRPVFHSLRVSEIIRETADAVSVAFDVPKELAPAFRFDPGQHLTLRTRLGGDEVRRAYSLCSGLADGHLRIAVKHIDGGLASPWVNRRLAVGDVVEVAAPAGRFRTEVNPLHQRHLLGIAAGSGITPILSILKSVLALEPRSRFSLLYGNRDADSTIFRDELAQLQRRYGERLQVVHVFSRCEKAEPRLRGRLGADKLDELAHLLDLASVDDAYLCGPRAMTLELRDALVAHGVDREHVHVELFGGPKATPSAATGGTSTERQSPAAAGAGHSVAVIDRGARSEIAVRADETVLDAALRAGLDLPYSCRDGVCGTCRAKLACGRVQQEGADLTRAEIDAGYVLTCQARPESDGVVISLDDA